MAKILVRISKEMYIQCFFNFRERDYILDPINCANSDRNIYSGTTVNQTSKQCIRYLGESMTLMLFHGFTVVKIEESTNESGFLLPNSVGNNKLSFIIIIKIEVLMYINIYLCIN